MLDDVMFFSLRDVFYTAPTLPRMKAFESPPRCHVIMFEAAFSIPKKHVVDRPSEVLERFVCRAY